MSSGMFSGINSGMLGLEMSPQQYQHLQPQQNPQNPNLSQQHPHTHQTMVSFGQNEVDHHHTQTQQPVKQGYPFGSKPRTQQLTFSDDDEPGGVGAEDSGGKRNASPWQRMKWTDAMVKLLIAMVFYIGDDQGGSEGNDVGKKKGGGGGGGAGGALQKKGKWKSVSKAMMERGFFVSPQQCEDKFNDLNKRYKRVNDILGKGTSCKVVENQSLLDTMDHLSPKIKEEVRKLLNSKHLFFREMCAYHNSCNGGAQHSAEAGADSSHIQQQQQRRACLHSSDNSPNVHNIIGRTETEGSKMMKGVSVEEDDDEDDEDDDNDEVEGGARGHDHDSDLDVKTSHKRTRNEMHASDLTSLQEFSSELKFVVQDGTKSSWEKRQWMRIRLMQLEEKRMNQQCQAFELEKQKMKWSKFRHKKERDMEAERLANERMMLQNERMVLMLRQKELELLDFQQQNQSM